MSKLKDLCHGGCGTVLDNYCILKGVYKCGQKTKRKLLL